MHIKFYCCFFPEHTVPIKNNDNVDSVFKWEQEDLKPETHYCVGVKSKKTWMSLEPWASEGAFTGSKLKVIFQGYILFKLRLQIKINITNGK